MKKEKKTSIEQAIDDLLFSGIPENITLGKLKDYLNQNKKYLIKAEDRFKNHLYPQYKLNWNKTYITNLEIYKSLGAKSIGIFNILNKLINKNNLVQISKSELNKEIQNALFCILPLDYMNFSFGQMTLLQQMYYGKIVITADVPSVRDYIINGKTGILYKHKDSEDLKIR